MSTELSYTLHVGTKEHSISTVGQLKNSLRHNLRQKTGQSQEDINIIIGEQTISKVIEEAKRIVREETEEARLKYNSQQKRKDRQIEDVFDYVSKDKKRHIAAEIIIELGDRTFWQRPDIKGHWDDMNRVYHKQIIKLQRLFPAYKIVSAVVHNDEEGCHMHILGIPIARGLNGPNQKLETCIAKSQVFNDESLEMIQQVMREGIIEELQKEDAERYKDITLKPKEEGRNQDIPIKEMNRYEKAREDLRLDLQLEQHYHDEHIEQMEREREVLAADIDDLEEEKEQLQNEINELRSQKQLLEKTYKAIEDSIRRLMERIRILMEQTIKRYKGIQVKKVMELNNDLILTREQADIYKQAGIHAEEGQKTISVLRKAERHDIREALLDAGLDRDDYDSDDVKRVHSLIRKGEEPEKAIKKVVKDILRSKDWPSLEDF